MILDTSEILAPKIIAEIKGVISKVMNCYLIMHI